MTSPNPDYLLKAHLLIPSRVREGGLQQEFRRVTNIQSYFFSHNQIRSETLRSIYFLLFKKGGEVATGISQAHPSSLHEQMGKEASVDGAAFRAQCCVHQVHYAQEQHPRLLMDFIQASLPLCTLPLTSSFITELIPPYLCPTLPL